MRFTGSGTTSIPRQTSTIFQVQVFVCYSIYFFLLKSCKRMLLLFIHVILCSRKGESCLISIRLCPETTSHWYDYTTYVNSLRKFQWLQKLFTGESLSSVRSLVKEMPSFKLWEITGCKSESKPKHVFVLDIQGQKYCLSTGRFQVNV